MTNQRYYTDNEITGDPVMRDERRYYTIHIAEDEPSLLMEGIWIIAIACSALCIVLVCFGLVD